MSCQLIIGPMMSGKTEELTRRLVRFSLGSQGGVVMLNNTKDTREAISGSGGVYSCHNPSHNAPKGIDMFKVETLEEFDKRSSRYQTIGIDEGQFFPDLATYVRKWLFQGKDLVVAGLNGDFGMRPLGKIHEVLCMATHVTKLYAVCLKCNKDKGRPFAHSKADFSLLKREHQENVKSDHVIIGGAEKFVPVCLECYREEMSL